MVSENVWRTKKSKLEGLRVMCEKTFPMLIAPLRQFTRGSEPV